MPSIHIHNGFVSSVLILVLIIIFSISSKVVGINKKYYMTELKVATTIATTKIFFKIQDICYIEN